MVRLKGFDLNNKQMTAKIRLRKWQHFGILRVVSKLEVIFICNILLILRDATFIYLIKWNVYFDGGYYRNLLFRIMHKLEPNNEDIEIHIIQY